MKATNHKILNFNNNLHPSEHCNISFYYYLFLFIPDMNFVIEKENKKNETEAYENIHTWAIYSYLNPILNVLEPGTTITVLLREFECSITESEGEVAGTPFSSWAVVVKGAEFMRKRLVISARGTLLVFLLLFFLKGGAIGGIGFFFFFLLLLLFFSSPLLGGMFSLLLSSLGMAVASIADVAQRRHKGVWEERKRGHLECHGGKCGEVYKHKHCWLEINVVGMCLKFSNGGRRERERGRRVRNFFWRFQLWSVEGVFCFWF